MPADRSLFRTVRSLTPCHRCELTHRCAMVQVVLGQPADVEIDTLHV